VSSYERTIGQQLLADELACLSYWLIEDEKKKGYFTLPELKPLLEVIIPFTSFRLLDLMLGISLPSHSKRSLSI
jgi:hypothetical protein